MKKLLSGIFVAVVGGLIVLYFKEILGAFTHAVSISLDACARFWWFVNQSVQVPIWLSVMVGFLALSPVAETSKKLLIRKKLPKHLTYTSDVLLGARWSWQWDNNGNVLTDSMSARCISCGFDLVFSDFVPIFPDRTNLYCENCGQCKNVGMSPWEYHERIVREIHYKIRSSKLAESV